MNCDAFISFDCHAENCYISQIRERYGRSEGAGTDDDRGGGGRMCGVRVRKKEGRPHVTCADEGGHRGVSGCQIEGQTRPRPSVNRGDELETFRTSDRYPRMSFVSLNDFLPFPYMRMNYQNLQPSICAGSDLLDGWRRSLLLSRVNAMRRLPRTATTRTAER